MTLPWTTVPEQRPLARRSKAWLVVIVLVAPDVVPPMVRPRVPMRLTPLAALSEIVFASTVVPLTSHIRYRPSLPFCEMRLPDDGAPISFLGRSTTLGRRGFNEGEARQTHAVLAQPESAMVKLSTKYRLMDIIRSRSLHKFSIRNPASK